MYFCSTRLWDGLTEVFPLDCYPCSFYFGAGMFRLEWFSTTPQPIPGHASSIAYDVLLNDL